MENIDCEGKLWRARKTSVHANVCQVNPRRWALTCAWETDALSQQCALWENHRVLQFASGQTFVFSVRENLVFGKPRVLQLSFFCLSKLRAQKSRSLVENLAFSFF